MKAARGLAVGLLLSGAAGAPASAGDLVSGPAGAEACVASPAQWRLAPGISYRVMRHTTPRPLAHLEQLFETGHGFPPGRGRHHLLR